MHLVCYSAVSVCAVQLAAPTIVGHSGGTAARASQASHARAGLPSRLIRAGPAYMPSPQPRGMARHLWRSGPDPFNFVPGRGWTKASFSFLYLKK